MNRRTALPAVALVLLAAIAVLAAAVVRGLPKLSRTPNSPWGGES